MNLFQQASRKQNNWIRSVLSYILRHNTVEVERFLRKTVEVFFRRLYGGSEFGFDKGESS